MRERYQINGSNTLFKVWGIVSLAITGIVGALYLLVLIMSLTMTSWISDEYGGLGGYVSDIFSAYMIWIFLILAIVLVVQAVADILLIRDYIIHKETLIVFAVLHFVVAAFCIFILMGGIAAGSVSVILIYLLISICWITTGVLLILKQGRAALRHANSVQAGNANYNPEWDVNPPVQATGMIEGMFGAYQGRRSELLKGKIYKIGRESGCEIQVNHPKVSRIHCTVCKLPNGKYQITDCSSNGTFYENNKLQKGVATEVPPGGMLVLGEPDNVLQLR